MLDDLIRVVPGERRPIIEEQKRLLDTGILRSFDDAEDRTRAAVGDLQGVGGAPPDHGGGRGHRRSAGQAHRGGRRPIARLTTCPLSWQWELVLSQYALAMNRQG